MVAYNTYIPDPKKEKPGAGQLQVARLGLERGPQRREGLVVGQAQGVEGRCLPDPGLLDVHLGSHRCVQTKE